MSNSPLVNYTKLSPNKSAPRNAAIKKITPHHMAGNLSVETCGKIFESPSNQASSNYSISSDGRVGMHVEEKNRAWTSSSPGNDNQAVTIEVANDEIGGNWHVSDTAMQKLIELCVDICKRNSINELNYTGDASGNLTHHNMFRATVCPGPYLQSKMRYIAEEVNKRLGRAQKPESDKATVPPKTASFSPYLARVTASALNIRKGPGTNYAVCGVIIDKGAYTIIEEQGEGDSKWGRLKSGAGWIQLSYTKKA